MRRGKTVRDEVRQQRRVRVRQHLASADRPRSGVTTYGTLDMARFDTNLTAADDRELRVEFLTVCQSNFTAMDKVVSTCAFNVATGRIQVKPDFVMPDAISVNDPTVAMKHMLVTTPFLWGEQTTVDEQDRVTAFLQLVPIDDTEMEYARVHSPEKLTELLQANQVDILDINRPSAVA
ncbi:suppressor of fused domain protein [Gordonia jinhuaensis]|nr:suppressor of fused domain protein [Gordonia jinhuaensis]